MPIFKVDNNKRADPFGLAVLRFLLTAHRSWFTVFCLFFAVAYLHAEESGDFLDANRDFAAGHYADAIRKYENISTVEGISAPLYFNLANAYFRAGEMGRAILNYERALALAPNDADIEANLRQARKAGGLFLPEPTFWERAVHFLGINGWTWLTSAALFLFCVSSGISLFSKRRAWRTLAGFSLLFLVIGGASLAFFSGDFKRAVILSPETPVRIGPFDTASTSSTLASGEIVQIQGSHENFFLVRSHGDKTGWVSHDQLEQILKD